MTETLLIGLGAQKAGTTWLSDYLRRHQPDVHQTPMKEVHFFDSYLMPQYGRYFEEQRLAAEAHPMPQDKRERAVRTYSKTYTDIFKRFDGHIPENWVKDMEIYL